MIYKLEVEVWAQFPQENIAQAVKNILGPFCKQVRVISHDGPSDDQAEPSA